MFTFETKDDCKLEVAKNVLDAICTSSFSLCDGDVECTNFKIDLTKDQLNNVMKVLDVESENRLSLLQLSLDEYDFMITNMMIPVEIEIKAQYIKDKILRTSVEFNSTLNLRSKFLNCILNDCVVRVNDVEYKTILESVLASKVIPLQIFCYKNVVRMISVEQGIPIYVIGDVDLPRDMLGSRSVAQKHTYGTLVNRCICECTKCSAHVIGMRKDIISTPCGINKITCLLQHPNMECLCTRNSFGHCGDIYGNNPCQGLLSNEMRFPDFSDLVSQDGHKYICSVVNNMNDVFTCCPTHSPTNITLALSNEEIANIITEVKESICLREKLPKVILAFTKR